MVILILRPFLQKLNFKAFWFCGLIKNANFVAFNFVGSAHIFMSWNVKVWIFSVCSIEE